MHECKCCGVPVYGNDLCKGCIRGNMDDCNPAETWHCFTGVCDGSGCTYPGECEE